MAIRTCENTSTLHAPFMNAQPRTAEIALSLVKAGIEASAPGAARSRKANWGKLPGHLERIEQVINIDDETCRCFGGTTQAIGEHVAERLDIVPATLRVMLTRRPRYGCRTCEVASLRHPLARARHPCHAGGRP